MSTAGGPQGAGPAPRPTGAVVLGALLALAGLIWLLAAADAVPVSGQVAVGILLVVVGAAVALLPPGGHHGVLVAAGIALAVAATAIVALSLHLLEASAGDRLETPATLADVRHRYSLGIGTLHLDLTRLEAEAPPGGSVPVTATIGIGELVVAVPEGAPLAVDARISAGEIEIRGERRSGLDVMLRREDDGDADVVGLTLRLEGAVGTIRVVDGSLGGAGADE
jgi:hypothetical protein